MIQHTSEQQKQDENQQKYEKTQMQREIVIQRLKEQGCRITKQRMVLLDIILNENCSSCKEIYYKASRIDSRIGISGAASFGTVSFAGKPSFLCKK